MTDRTPLPPRDPAPRMTRPLTEAPSAHRPLLFQARALPDRMIDAAETGRVR